MKQQIFAAHMLAVVTMVAGCSDQSGANPAESKPLATPEVEQARPAYRRSVPPPVKAEEFHKAGMRGAASPQVERK